ncbi:MAG: peptidoglycan-binding protein [Elusimicrobia bacterium]|nr:peptidoglycan-binding protein [Elusimicrobiota bacterium]
MTRALLRTFAAIQILAAASCSAEDPPASAPACEEVPAPKMERAADGHASLPSAAPVACKRDSRDMSLVPYFKNARSGKEEFGWIETDASNPDQTRRYMELYSQAAHLYSRQNSALSRDVPTRVSAGTGALLQGDRDVPPMGPAGPVRDAPGMLEYVPGRQMPRGQEVRSLQQQLVNAGITTAALRRSDGRLGRCQESHLQDGILGPCTSAAIREFQKHYSTVHSPDGSRPLTADGRYTNETQQALRALTADQRRAIREAMSAGRVRPALPTPVPPQAEPPPHRPAPPEAPDATRPKPPGAGPASTVPPPERVTCEPIPGLAACVAVSSNFRNRTVGGDQQEAKVYGFIPGIHSRWGPQVFERDKLNRFTGDRIVIVTNTSYSPITQKHLDYVERRYGVKVGELAIGGHSGAGNRKAGLNQSVESLGTRIDRMILYDVVPSINDNLFGPLKDRTVGFISSYRQPLSGVALQRLNGHYAPLPRCTAYYLEGLPCPK